MNAFAQFAVVLAGLIPAVVFLLLHGRPTRLLRAEAINATGWIVIVVLQYTRALSLLSLKMVHHQSVGYGSASQATLSIGLGLMVDALVIVRLVSFVRWRAARRALVPA